MKDHVLLELVGRAFTCGEIDALVPYLMDECESDSYCTYHSDYASKTIRSANEIIAHMKEVYAKIDDSNKYSFTPVMLRDIINPEMNWADILSNENGDLCESALLLYQFDSAHPAAIVLITVGHDDRIAHIELSRNKKWFPIDFYREDVAEDSSLDVPSTVKPLTGHYRHVQELERSSRQHPENDKTCSDDSLYIWRKADEFFKRWLIDRGYRIDESSPFEDCIGYKCVRNGFSYAIYLYAYGKEPMIYMDGAFCRKLKNYSFSEKRNILIMYLNVKRFVEGGAVKYVVCCSSGNEKSLPDLWWLRDVNGKSLLTYFPCMEIVQAGFKLMYAFNHDSLDAYERVVVKKNPSMSRIGYQGYSYNDAFYSQLIKLHKEYGDMKLGFVRYNDVTYSGVPYLEGLGFFGFTVSPDNYIEKIDFRSFSNDDKQKYLEFIKTDESDDAQLYAHIPQMIDVRPLSPVMTERFAVICRYDNGECRKYVLPIDVACENDEVVSFDEHVFTDKIWSSALVVATREPQYPGYPQCGQGIRFVNGYSISTLTCYEDGKPYSEPVLCNEQLFSDEQVCVNKLWEWAVNSIYESGEPGVLKVLISGFAFNYDGISTFITIDGRRLTSLNFDYTSTFSEGLAQVGIRGYGYGFVDRDMKIVIPMQYDDALGFVNGRAKVKKNGEWMQIDQCGNEMANKFFCAENRYEEICEFCEGLCRVSTLKLEQIDLAYHSDYDPGIWGFINEDEQEVIAPQYIYAFDFEEGLAIVAKGEWTRDPKWDNKNNSDKYWTEQELWGAIDKTGHEIIPCIFDEIKTFADTNDVFMAHYGGWDNGKWGVIDRKGEWVAEPTFDDFGYEYRDGLITFYASDKWDDDVPLGIYDLKQKRVLFEPQFFDVDFCDDGWINVEVFDETLDRRVEKLIDRTGKERFKSEYTSIYTWKIPYEVMIRDENGARHGLIDTDGNVILPCKFDVAWNGISHEKRLMIVKEAGRQGLRDFEGNEVIPADYYELHGLHRPLLTTRVGEKDNYKEGLISYDGKTVIPAEYERIYWLSNSHFVCCRNGYSCLCELKER